MNTSYLNKLQTALKGCKCSVFVYAYTNLNVGDDLFLHKLFPAYPDVHFVLLAKKPYRKMFSGYRNVTVYEEEGLLLSACRKLRIDDKLRWRIPHECDYALYIAGSIFKEYSEWSDQYIWYRELFDPDRMYFLGCSWGPCKTREFEENMTSVLSGMKDVCFRDRYSYHTFAHLPNVRYAPDILFGLDWSAYAGVEEKKQVFLSVVNCRAGNVELPEYAGEYNRFIARLAERFAELGYRSVLCSFCENESDLPAAEEIRSQMPPHVRENTPIVNYTGTNLQQILQLLAESEYVVATRFHAMILGMVAGKKVLPMIYHLKLRNVLEDLSFQGACCDIRRLPPDPDGLIGQITRGISDAERKRLATLAAGHFDGIDQVLKNR